MPIWKWGDAAWHMAWRYIRSMSCVGWEPYLIGRWEGWKWDFIAHSVPAEKPGWAHFVKAGTSPWPNPIKRFEGWRVQSVSAGYRSPLELSSRLSQTKKRDIVCEEIQEEEEGMTIYDNLLYPLCPQKIRCSIILTLFLYEARRGSVKLFRRSYIKHRHDQLWGYACFLLYFSSSSDESMVSRPLLCHPT